MTVARVNPSLLLALLVRYLRQAPPAWVCFLFAVTMAFAGGLRMIAAKLGALTLSDAGSVVLIATGVLMWTVVTWHRDEDALSAGVMLAVTIAGGGLAIAVVSTIVATGSISVALAATLVTQPVTLIQLAILVPVCTAVVWTARRISTALKHRWIR
jgi:hypothetical protein